MKNLSVIFPIAASIAAFVLVLLALLAGQNPGFMEDYDVISFNTSALGKNLVLNAAKDDEPTPTGGGFCSDLPGFLGKGCATATAAIGSIESAIVSEVNDIANDIADHLSAELGIHQFYSLHALSICEGSFSPNATANGATRNVTRCIKGATEGYNISAIIDHQLQIGPFELGIDDLGFDDELQSAMDTLNSAIKAFVILLSISVALTGLSLLTSIAGFIRYTRPVLIVNVVIASLAFIMLLACSLVITIGARKAATEVTEKGDDIGLYATAGSKYTAITWAAVGLMFVTFAYWLWQVIRFKNGKTDLHRQTKRSPRDSEEAGAEKPNLHGIRFSKGRRSRR
ncbi:actin cortical patch SUR7/pH-response regulator pali [Podospora didyma]|uniref:Actin cortical patch SUR7/pH-response regulator pali n=1 Tax=Podospora didyma TaxID=330526 RepID=A0AAE0P4X0_9PEZI|nr:actin cortical patch SUR7/pH-response regulator pali [Podospora didyma]